MRCGVIAMSSTASDQNKYVTVMHTQFAIIYFHVLHICSSLFMCRAKSLSVPQVTMPARKRSTADIQEFNCSMYVSCRHETYVCIHDIVEAVAHKSGLDHE